MQPFIHILPLNGDQFAIRQLLNPIAEGTPFVQFVILPALIDIKQYLIIKNNCPPLVVRRWEKLYHLPPYILLTGDSRISAACLYAASTASRCSLIALSVLFTIILTSSILLRPHIQVEDTPPTLSRSALRINLMIFTLRLVISIVV